MKAAVLTNPGAATPSECFTIDHAYPKPSLPSEDWLLIRVRAAGLNRAELRSREGYPGHILEFNFFRKEYREDPPKIIGEEMVGEVDRAGTNTEFQPGDKVAAWMFGGGKAFDGSYAEYAICRKESAIKLETSLPWEILGGAIMSMWTAHGALDICANMRPRSTVVVHGATSSVGVWGVLLAKDIGCEVIATTRQESKVERLGITGADHIVLDKDLGDSLPKLAPQGVDTWLELVGPEYNDSVAFRSMARHGTVVDVGMLTMNITMGDFSPTTMGPTVKLTMYTTMPEDFDDKTASFLRHVIKKIEKGVFKPAAFLDRVFPLEEIGAAHEWMEANKATGKVVIII